MSLAANQSTLTPSDVIASLAIPPDPANRAPYPHGLILDLALGVGTLAEILDSYNLTPLQFKDILANPVFQHDYSSTLEEMKTEGWTFRKKAQAQAELYLNLTYRLATSDQTPAAVRADLIKHTVKWAGLDSPVQAQAGNQIDTSELANTLKALPDGELELRILQIVMRKTGTAQPQVVLGETYEAA